MHPKAFLWLCLKQFAKQLGTHYDGLGGRKRMESQPEGHAPVSIAQEPVQFVATERFLSLKNNSDRLHCAKDGSAAMASTRSHASADRSCMMWLQLAANHKALLSLNFEFASCFCCFHSLTVVLTTTLSSASPIALQRTYAKR